MTFPFIRFSTFISYLFISVIRVSWRHISSEALNSNTLNNIIFLKYMVHHMINKVSLTSWSRVLLENLIVAQLTKKLFTICRTPKFITLSFSRQWLWRLLFSINPPVSFCTYVPTVRINILPPSSGQMMKAARSSQLLVPTSKTTQRYSLQNSNPQRIIHTNRLFKRACYGAVSWASSHHQTLLPRDAFRKKFLLLKGTPTDNYSRYTDRYRSRDSVVGIMN
jgi:hypothetical protein